MKEEEYRDALALNLLRGSKGSKRLSISGVLGWNNQYTATPQGDQLGQMVFALDMCAGLTYMGTCVSGSRLVPWGVCCLMYCNVNSACSAQSCTTCGFCLCGTGTFVALGSMMGCGATLWRRIA